MYRTFVYQLTQSCPPLFEILATEALPLELHRNYTLIRQLDESAEGRFRHYIISITRYSCLQSLSCNIN